MRTFELSTHVKVISRSKGHSATAAAAYRAGVRITCKKNGRVHDYSRREGVVTASVVLPKGNPSVTRSRLWNDAETKDKRKNSRTAREFMFSLPVEMSPEGRQEVVERFSRHLASRHGVAVDYAIHAPPRDGDPRNHHAHLLMTTRRLKNGELKEKTRELDDLATGAVIVKEWRRIVAGLLNSQLEHEQSCRQAVRVEYRSFADRKIERQPTKHRGKANRRAVVRLKALFAKAAEITKCALIQTRFVCGLGE